MKKFEYYTLILPITTNQSPQPEATYREEDAQLQTLGREGWELVAVTHESGWRPGGPPGTTTRLFYLKRPVPDRLPGNLLP